MIKNTIVELLTKLTNKEMVLIHKTTFKCKKLIFGLNPERS